jgi:hypothetical protein
MGFRSQIVWKKTYWELLLLGLSRKAMKIEDADRISNEKSRSRMRLTQVWIWICTIAFKQCWGSVTFWCGSGPLTNGSGSDYFLQWRIKNYFIFFHTTFPQAHHLFQTKKCNFCAKIFVEILFVRRYFSPLNTVMRKGKDPDPYLWLMDPDPGGPKTFGSL